MKHIIFLAFISFINFGISQKNLKQDHLSGHVFELNNNESLSPLTGVNVSYSGTNSGTTTDTSGVFSIPQLKDNNILIFSYVGYNTDTLKIKSNQEINVVMREGKILEDLIVEFKKGSYIFSKTDPRNAHIIGQDELRKAACCALISKTPGEFWSASESVSVSLTS